VCGRGVGELIGANPVDRGKAGSKYHLLIDVPGIPLAVGLSAANTPTTRSCWTSWSTPFRR
jgi:hypothetical protein